MASVKISLEFGYSEFFAHNSYGTIDNDDADWDDLNDKQLEYILSTAPLTDEEEAELRELVAKDKKYLADWDIVEVDGGCDGRRCSAECYWEQVISLDDWNALLKENPNHLQELKDLGMKVVKSSKEEEL